MCLVENPYTGIMRIETGVVMYIYACKNLSRFHGCHNLANHGAFRQVLVVFIVRPDSIVIGLPVHKALIKSGSLYIANEYR